MRRLILAIAATMFVVSISGQALASSGEHLAAIKRLKAEVEKSELGADEKQELLNMLETSKKIRVEKIMMMSRGRKQKELKNDAWSIVRSVESMLKGVQPITVISADAVKLSGDEIAALVGNNSIIRQRGPRHVVEWMKPDGTFQASWREAENGSTKTGTEDGKWQVKDDSLCWKWKREYCATLAREGDRLIGEWVDLGTKFEIKISAGDARQT